MRAPWIEVPDSCMDAPDVSSDSHIVFQMKNNEISAGRSKHLFWDHPKYIPGRIKRYFILEDD